MNTPASNLPDSIWRRTLYAMSVALTINIILYYGGQLLAPGGLLVMQGPGAPLEPLPFAAVVFITAITMMIGSVIYWLLQAFVSEVPNTTFTILAVVVVLVSLAGPLFLASGIVTQVVLTLMHIAAAGSLVWFLTR